LQAAGKSYFRHNRNPAYPPMAQSQIHAPLGNVFQDFKIIDNWFFCRVQEAE
jgi:hypothetical protein